MKGKVGERGCCLGKHNISTQPGFVVFANIKHFDNIKSELCMETDSLHILGKC